MVKTTFLPLVIIYCIKKIPLNIYDKPPIPEEFNVAHIHKFIKPSIVCILNPYSQQPRVFSAVHQRGCFLY